MIHMGFLAAPRWRGGGMAVMSLLLRCHTCTFISSSSPNHRICLVMTASTNSARLHATQQPPNRVNYALPSELPPSLVRAGPEREGRRIRRGASRGDAGGGIWGLAQARSG
uniref:Secreted protein n=1 Tax=Arundo donax TaxID=35708 RepID=A0A0A9GKB9_ARUDO